jgi:hypothetical protein
MAWKRSVASTLMITATLTACSATGPHGMPALSEDQQTSDELPGTVAESGSLDPSTSRLLATADGIRYFAAESASSDDLCFVVYESRDSWGTGCSTGLPIGVKLNGHPEALLSTYVDETDEWMPLGENVVIRKE